MKYEYYDTRTGKKVDRFDAARRGFVFTALRKQKAKKKNDPINKAKRLNDKLFSLR